MAIALVGCDRALIVPSRRDGGSMDAGRATPDAGRPGGGIRIPPNPGGADTDGAERVYVLRDPVLNQTGGLWETLGWDLDGRCTYMPRVDAGMPSTDGGVDGGTFGAWDLDCLPRRPDMAPPIIDGEECRDNAWGVAISPGLATAGRDLEGDTARAMAEGRYAILVRLRGWNGEDDDPRVVADAFATVYGVPSGGRRGDPLAWDGTDDLFLAEETIAAPPLPDDQAIMHDELAYVAGGLFVMRLPERAEFTFSSASYVLRLRVTDGAITGRVRASSPHMEGVLMVGRWPLADLCAELPALGLCEGDPVLRPLVENAVNSSADVLERSRGPGSPLVPCEAVSVAIGWRGYPGRVGGTARFPGTPSPCP